MYVECNVYNIFLINTTRNHQEVYFLSKVIELSTRLLKSDLLKSCDEIMMTMNCMKIAKYFRDMK